MTRRLLVLAAGLLVAGALVAPVVLTGQDGSTRSHCAPSLRFRQQLYERRSGSTAGTAQSTAIGVGVVSGCGRAPTNVNVRSLLGVRPARAIAIDGDTALYVRSGVCRGLTAARLDRCLAGS